MTDQLPPVHSLSFADPDSRAYFKARHHYLLQIIFGETMAIDYCKTIAMFAPTEEAAAFLIRQQLEEDTHLELLTEYVGLHPRPEVLISPSLKKMHFIMADAIARKDYIASIFVQNFIVEGLNISLLKELQHHTDSNLSELAQRILKDEVGHMEFGVTEIGKLIAQNKDSKLMRKLTKLHRTTLIHSIGLAKDLAREARYLGIPMGEFTKRTISEHHDRIRRAHFPLSCADRLLFSFAEVFLSLF